MSEALAVRGLDVRGYAGKWAKAKDMALAHERGDHDRMPYWDRVRLLFLELGGQYADQPQ
jgi:hypothetical protein